MKDGIDAAIKREFDHLGFNVVDNENLAELIITRSRRNSMQKLIKVFALGVTIALIAASIFFLSKNRNSAMPVSTTSVSSKASSQSVSVIPLFASIQYDGSKSRIEPISFSFDLNQGEVIEYVTQIPYMVRTSMGKMFVIFYGEDGKSTQVITYEIGSTTNIQEFGVQMTGKYEFRLQLEKSPYKGEIKVIVVRAR